MESSGEGLQRESSDWSRSSSRCGPRRSLGRQVDDAVDIGLNESGCGWVRGFYPPAIGYV